MKKLLSILFVLLLTACGTSLASDLSQPGSVLFQDDFSSAVGKWPQGNAQNGSLHIANGAYQVSVSLPNYQIPALTGNVYRDVRVEVLATRVEGPLENLFGLICRAQDAGNYYFFAISSDGYYTIGKVKDGNTSLLGQEMMAYSDAILRDDTANLLQFECMGQVLSGSVNDQLIASTQDADFSTGGAGVITGTFEETGVEISFDNFSVVKP